MCDYRVDVREVCAGFGSDPAELLRSAPALDGLVADGIIRRDGDVVALEDKARPLVRVLAAALDQYLGAAPARHSRTV